MGTQWGLYWDEMFSNGGQYLAKPYLSEYDVVVPEILIETDGRGR
jgi:hypothetical protein